MADENLVIEGFNVRIRKEMGVYVATVKELPGCVNEGKTADEAAKKIRGSIDDYLLVLAKGMEKKPKPKTNKDSAPKKKRRGAR